MGGCRCTYRNCRIKSDGKTHMFHYPVFDKIRCHQWLLNAHRLDFLELKVSQLKNRVICQHHFKDENFMNFKKGKLTFDAIPTEDGPYCDATNYEDYNQDLSKLYSIVVDDIEDDMTGCDKKANISMKYGDFLTNLDLMDVEKINEDDITCKNKNNNFNILLPPEDNGRDKFISDDGSFVFNLSLPDKNDRKVINQPMLVVSPYIYTNKVNKNEIANNYQPYKTGNMYLNKPNTLAIREDEKKESSEQKEIKKESKVRIISEKKITNPLPITGKFESVSPNFVLNVSKIKKDVKANSVKPFNDNTKNITEHREILFQEPFEVCVQEPSVQEVNKKLEIEIEPVKVKEEVNPPSKESQCNMASEKSTKMTLLKPRVPPERVEAINKKRKFNMKLRDIVESCLDKLDISDKASEDSIQVENTRPKKRVNPQHQQTIQFQKEPTPVLEIQDPTIAFLEDRMRKMENTLLEKIEQNSGKINELKNIYRKTSSAKKPTVQTRTDEEVHKKQLFQEISKYLSPSTKSQVYEELFINKYTVVETDISQKRKRRR